jgi:hypothetical protein
MGRESERTEARLADPDRLERRPPHGEPGHSDVGAFGALHDGGDRDTVAKQKNRAHCGGKVTSLTWADGALVMVLPQSAHESRSRCE